MDRSDSLFIEPMTRRGAINAERIQEIINAIAGYAPGSVVPTIGATPWEPSAETVAVSTAPSETEDLLKTDLDRWQFEA